MNLLRNLLLSVGALLLTGCNNCEKLTDAICKDLGAEDCATWKASGGPDQILPSGRKVNKACGTFLGNDAVYQGLVKTARGQVIGEQMKQAGSDPAKMAELVAKLKALTGK
jgi:hypothetical protein